VAGERGLANEIRTGLNQTSETAVGSSVPRKQIDPLDELFFNRPVRMHVREFGALFGAICFGFGAIRGYRHEFLTGTYILFAAGCAFVALGYLKPAILRPVWKAWMSFAHVLSLVMTWVVMSLSWVVGFVPMALLLRALGIKRIDLTYDPAVVSYWEIRDAKYDDFMRLERQF